MYTLCSGIYRSIDAKLRDCIDLGFYCIGCTTYDMSFYIHLLIHINKYMYTYIYIYIYILITRLTRLYLHDSRNRWLATYPLETSGWKRLWEWTLAPDSIQQWPLPTGTWFGGGLGLMVGMELEKPKNIKMLQQQQQQNCQFGWNIKDMQVARVSEEDHVKRKDVKGRCCCERSGFRSYLRTCLSFEQQGCCLQVFLFPIQWTGRRNICIPGQSFTNMDSFRNYPSFPS